MLTKEQLATRRSGIGGSDVASILGISPWKSAYDVYVAKTSDATGDDLDGKDHIIFGNLMEPVIREEFSRRNGKTVITSDEVFRHPEHDFMLANVDGILDGENAGLEIKTASEYSSEQWGEDGTDHVPAYYLTQGLHYMAVMGWDRIYFAVVIGGNKYKQYVVERDEEAIASLIAVEKRFWENHVIAKVPPPRPVEVLRDVWSSTTGQKKEANLDILAAVEQYKQIKADVTELSKKQAELEAVIKEYIADADELTYNGKKIASWKFNKSSMRFVADKLKQERPDLYEMYVSEVPGPRVFRVA